MADCKPCQPSKPSGLADPCERTPPACATSPSANMQLTITPNEQALFDSIASELVGLVGTEAELLIQDIKGATRDPLYDEPVIPKWKGPFKIKVYVEAPSSAIEVREEGQRSVFDSSVWIARVDLEKVGAPYPSEGDMIMFWNTPFWKDFGVDSEPVPGKQFAFDVINVDVDGYLFDTPSFVGCKMMVRRRTDFTPERRITME